MTFPFTVYYRNNTQKTVWIDAENENDANEYSLNYWSDPEVTGVESFVERDEEDAYEPNEFDLENDC